jgi:SAM-dependent methyltransferase
MTGVVPIEPADDLAQDGPAPAGDPRVLIERLNAEWRIAGPPPSRATARQRLLHPIRRILARLFGTQETFNSAVVQYINFIQWRHDMLERELRTALCDLRDALNAATDDLRRHRDALGARDRRLQSALETIRSTHDELRTTVSVLQHAVRHLARRTERATDPASPSPPAGASTDATATLSYQYVGFEDRFRGSQEAIRAALADYLELFGGASDVLDVGCGRGEFLDLLRERGIGARGIDVNEAMVEVCRKRGLEAYQADALAYLREQPDGSLGGLFAAQVVEHLEPAYLTRLLELAFDKLRPGAPIVLETINPACWFAFFESYIRDITHVRALHPDTLKFLLIASGFQRVEIRYRAPYPEHEKLQPIASAALGDAADILNANVAKLNALLFTYLDYAAIGVRP